MGRILRRCEAHISGWFRRPVASGKSTIKTLLASDRLGRFISIRASEGVEPFHQAHSFVRGHWSKSADSIPMIVAKCSHDADLLCWLAGSAPAKISSFGGLEWFRPANAPPHAPPRCTDGTQIGSLDIAIRKAVAAVHFKRPTKDLQDLIAKDNLTFVLSLPNVTAVEGGLPILHDGQVIGAIGISGVTAAQNGIIAAAGITAFR